MGVELHVEDNSSWAAQQDSRKEWQTPAFTELPFRQTLGVKSTSPDLATGDYYPKTPGGPGQGTGTGTQNS